MATSITAEPIPQMRGRSSWARPRADNAPASRRQVWSSISSTLLTRPPPLREAGAVGRGVFVAMMKRNVQERRKPDGAPETSPDQDAQAEQDRGNAVVPGALLFDLVRNEVRRKRSHGPISPPAP